MFDPLMKSMFAVHQLSRAHFETPKGARALRRRLYVQILFNFLLQHEHVPTNSPSAESRNLMRPSRELSHKQTSRMRAIQGVRLYSRKPPCRGSEEAKLGAQL